jgi:hypothetical protein
MARRVDAVQRPIDYLHSGKWPEGTVDGSIPAEYARRIAVKLTAAINKQDLSIYEAARRCSVSRETLVRALAGETYPDLLTLARLETGLGVPLWPTGLHRIRPLEAT